MAEDAEPIPDHQKVKNSYLGFSLTLRKYKPILTPKVTIEKRHTDRE